MTIEYLECPKCKYVSPDNLPLGEICGSCGLVFRKYEAIQLAEMSARHLANPTPNSIHSETTASTESGERHKQRRKNPQVKAIAQLATVICLLGVVGYYIYLHYFSPESEVLQSWRHYNSLAMRERALSYDLLTEFSQLRISRLEWIAKFRKQDPRYEDGVVLTTMVNEEKAVLSINRIDETGEVVKRYIQTWLRHNDEWRRAYVEDNSDETDVAANRAIGVNQRAQGNSSSAAIVKSLKEAIVIEGFTTTWEVEKSSLSRNFLYKPTTRVKIQNTGELISELRMMVRYIDTTRNELFDKDEKSVVTRQDVPMAKTERRTLIFSSSKGFVVEMNGLTATDAKNYRKLANKYNAVLYFKGSYNESWQRYDE